MRLVFPYPKTSKTLDFETVSLFKPIRKSIEDQIDDFYGLFFSQLFFSGQSRDKVWFVHDGCLHMNLFWYIDEKSPLIQ